MPPQFIPPKPNSHHLTHSGYRTLSVIIYLFGVSLLAHFISRRFKLRDITSISPGSYSRLLIFFLFVDSWLFLFCGSVLIDGPGMELNNMVCSLGIYACIAFYGTSKFFVYLFFIRNVLEVWNYALWNSPSSRKRRMSPVFIFCIALFLSYMGITIYLVIRRLSYLNTNGACMIGLKSVASAPLLSYYLFVDISFASLFLWPLYRSCLQTIHLRRMALHNLWAAAIALTASCVNILMLMLFNGRQLAWICLGSCAGDVIVNAMVLFWLSDKGVLLERTTGTSSNERPTQSGAVSSVVPGRDTAQGPSALQSVGTDISKEYHEDPQSLPSTRSGRLGLEKPMSMLSNPWENRHNIEVTITTEVTVVDDDILEISLTSSEIPNEKRRPP